MKTLRRLHLLLGCFFAPVLIYFALSGIWQTMRWDDRFDKEGNREETLLQEWSKPHQYQTLPGANTKIEHSWPFAYFTSLMGIGIIATTFLGVYMAFRVMRSQWIIIACLTAGILLPFFFLWMGTN